MNAKELREAAETLKAHADLIDAQDGSEQSEIMEILSKMYAIIWPEACYDARSQATAKFARELLPHINRLNEILRFRR